MKANDAVTGAALVALGLFILHYIQGFPAMPGQRFGPAWFPGIAAGGLAICGAVLVVRGMQSRVRWIELAAWTRRARPVTGFLSVPAALAFYVVAAGALGFHLAGFIILLACTRILGARLAVALPVALVAPIVIHLVFYKLLRVPLPWGVLERFAI